MGKKEKIRDCVMMILTKDEKARNSDRYLYVQVVKELNPQLLNMSFKDAMLNDIPCMETVRRSRQLIQHNFPNLKGNDDVTAMRELEEEEWKKRAINWGIKLENYVYEKKEVAHE